MKEYGTNVQKLVNHILTVQDKNTRTKYAYLLVELMRQVHPNMRDSQDYSNKLWDDLYIMSNFKLDVDSPFPPPSPDAVGKLPKPVPYNTHFLKYRYYGRNVELLIARAISETDDNEKRILVAHIARLMKTFYQNWNREVVDDEVIWGHILELSEGLLAQTVQAISGNSSLGNLRNNNNNRSNTNNDRRGDNRNDNRNNNGRQNFNGRNDNNGRNNDNRNRNDNRNNNGGRNDNRSSNNNNNNRNRR
ncbi:MAG: DUF4290 domain-containing protein [Arcicella sp.]|jgi:hypothetical protein|nr:DUF4290 domain-containing protein [Arcicella sp.]